MGRAARCRKGAHGAMTDRMAADAAVFLHRVQVFILSQFAGNSPLPPNSLLLRESSASSTNRSPDNIAPQRLRSAR